MKIFALFLIFTMASILPCNASGVTAATFDGQINNMIARVIVAKAASSGIASTDPRINATYAGVSAAFGAVANSIKSVSSGQAIRWLPVLAKMGWRGGVSAAIAVTLYAGYEWLFAEDGETVSPEGSAVSYTGDGPAVYNGDIVGAISAGTCPYSYFGGGINYCFYSKMARAAQRFTDDYTYYTTSTGFTGGYTVTGGYVDTCNSGNNNCFLKLIRADGLVFSAAAAMDSPGGGSAANSEIVTCNTYILNGVCQSDSPAENWHTNPGTTYTPDPDQSPQPALEAINPADYGEPLDTSMIAQAVTRAWADAAEDAGSTWGGLSPAVISTGEVDSVKSSSPSGWPSVGGAINTALNPALSPSGGTSGTSGSVLNPTIPYTGGNPTTAAPPTTSIPTNPAADQPLINIGDDPQIGFPGLEAIPSAASILSPLTGLFPGLKTFTVPEHTGTCPTAEFSVFGQEIVMDAQCTIAETIRDALAAAMLLVWSLVGLFKLLEA